MNNSRNRIIAQRIDDGTCFLYAFPALSRPRPLNTRPCGAKYISPATADNCGEHDPHITERLNEASAQKFAFRRFFLVVSGTALIVTPATADMISGRLLHGHKLMTHIFFGESCFYDFNT